ncbi:MAG: PD-(D/E)XK nuclease family protein, partial [Cetobacterium sp.]
MQLPKIDLTKINNDNGKDNELTKSIKDAIKNSGRRLWSYSRLSKYHNCKYEYYLGYILRPKNPRDNVYSTLGGIVHECLEGFIKKEYSREQMIQKFELIYSDCKIPKIDNTVILKFPSEKIEKNYI